MSSPSHIKEIVMEIRKPTYPNVEARMEAAHEMVRHFFKSDRRNRAVADLMLRMALDAWQAKGCPERRFVLPAPNGKYTTHWYDHTNMYSKHVDDIEGKSDYSRRLR